MKIINIIKYTTILATILVISSCYSFTGSSLSPETKTIKITPFINNSPLSNAALAQQFTIDLQNRFLQRTTLKGTTQNPDISIDGEIVEYTVTPTTVSAPTQTTTGTFQSAQNKLTITVKVQYQNKIEPEKNFNKTFTDEAVFSSSLTSIEIENTQVRIVNERIINKIFNDIVANW